VKELGPCNGPVGPSPEGSPGDWYYFKLVSSTVVAALFLYWGPWRYFRQQAVDPLLGLVVGSLALTSVALFYVGRLHRKALPDDPPSHPVIGRYRALLEDLSGFEQEKRRIIEAGLEPQLTELIEEKLPQLLLRRDRYRSYWKRCDVLGVTKEIASLEQRVAGETDEDIQRALQRNLGIARSTLENYRALEKTLKLYELQISSIEKHLENLQSKLHILDFDDDIKAAADEIIFNINGDIDDLERALTNMDRLGLAEAPSKDGARGE
jgi:hypothetical protein